MTGSALAHMQSDKQQVFQNGKVKGDNISYVNSSTFAIAFFAIHPSGFSTIPHEYRPKHACTFVSIYIHINVHQQCVYLIRSNKT